MPESTFVATIEKHSFDLSRERVWILENLEAGYAGARHYLWMAADAPSERGRRLLGALDRLGAEGLDATEYGLADIRTALDTLAEIPEADSVSRTRARVDIEIRLSIGLLSLARDLVRGRFDPAEARQDWLIEPEPLPADLLGRVRDGESVEGLLTSLRPRMPHYGRLVDALAKLGEVRARGGWPRVQVARAPGIGWTGDGVATLRARLRASEDSVERRLATLGGSSDVFDADLAGAVRRYQSRHGIEPDGIPGAATLRELNTPVEARIEAVALNLDRLRWLPRDLGERVILVNVAGFEFELLEDHEPRMAMNVIVGRERWATRLFTARMDHLVLNPYWNVPRSILTSEILPAERRDPGYLARNGFEVFGAGESVRQRPGPRNALGRVKFMFPNPYGIYLHDTPDDHLFTRSHRAFSHGCIRLERPLELARHLIEGHTSRAAADVDRILESGRTVAIPLDRAVDVYVVYLTAWVDGDGAMHFYRDIYDRDDALRDRIGSPRLGEGGL